MENSLEKLWVVCLWYFGISTTVTLGLFGWIIRINSKINIGDSIDKDIRKMAIDIEEIKKALTGDYEKKGLITKHYELESRVKDLEDKEVKK